MLAKKHSYPSSKLLVASLIILSFVYKLDGSFFKATLCKAWDGAGHHAISSIYSAHFYICFGWINNFIGGFSFPNFYPPFFYLVIAIIYRTHIFDSYLLLTLMVIFPILFIPQSIISLGKNLKRDVKLVIGFSAMASLLLLIDQRFIMKLAAGVDAFSTFQLGLYTQPLGFVLLVLWYAVYSNLNKSRWQFFLSSVLLVLTILSSFFAAIAAAIFILTTLMTEIVYYIRADKAEERKKYLSAIYAHLLIPLISLLLCLFWIVPMVSEYKYFVTRPHVINVTDYLTPVLWCWCLVAVIGAIIWLRQSTVVTWSYLGGCFAIALGILISLIAPSWFPLQGPRFLAMLIFLLTVPVGVALAAAYRGIAVLLGELRWKDETFSLRRTPYTLGIAVIVLLVLGFTSPGPGIQYAFYPPEGQPELNGVLKFGREHKEGRYLVEMPSPREPSLQYDSRAMSAYLGAQGNEALYGIFHEASVNSLFFLPVINTFSAYPYHFGISSILGDDRDFMAQPLSKHLERARMIGTRYLVINSPAMKSRLADEPTVGTRQDIDRWSIFELKEPLPQPARVLSYRPALLVSKFTVKERRRNERNFIRYAEEQFADGWFDVLLSRADEERIDRLQNLERFGAIVLDSYECDDEQAAFDQLKRFAEQRTLILLASEESLYQRILFARSQFKHLEIIERTRIEPGEKVNSLEPTYHYNSSPLRQEWAAIRQALDKSKVPVTANSVSINRVIDEKLPTRIKLDFQGSGVSEPVPVLISTTFYPKWRRSDGGEIYAATPFFMLTFLDKSVTLDFSRRWYDWAALWISALTLFALCSYTVWHYRQRLLNLWPVRKSAASS